MELYIKAAEQNLPQAQNNLAFMYANVFQDNEKAKYWFQRAADNGYEPAVEVLKGIK
ncbi:hypothetical protein [Acinetobacter gerneri]|uniref:hypothetical protein n=1 Tax=Acinetobacter gerneri TaxID=202952 RepID=UPI003D21344B